MGTLLLNTVLGVTFIVLGISIIITRNDDYDSISHRLFEYFRITIVVSLASFFLFAMIYSLLNISYENNTNNLIEQPYQEYDLVSLNDNRDINVSIDMLFFVGSGYIDQDLYYYFYIKNSKTGLIEFKKELANSNYNKIYIKEIEKGEKPRYIKYGYYLKDKESIWYTPNLIDISKTILYIPKGSILNEIKLDLE